MQTQHREGLERWHILRHARPLVGEGICYGRYNMPADVQATSAAAQEFARYWLDVNGSGAVADGGAGGLQVQLLSSPLQRCQQLAQALLPLLADAGVCVQMKTEPALAEMDFGCWEGQSWNALPSDEWERWMGDFAGYRVGGGESTRAMLQRVHGAAQSTAAQLAANAQERVIWVSHAGVICALHWLQSQGCLLRERQGVQTLQAGNVPVPQIAEDWPQHAACAYGQWRVVAGYACGALAHAR